MAGYYAKAAKPLLRDKLDELAALPPDERHTLADEIDLARVMTDRALRLFEAANFGEKEASPETKAMSFQALQRALQFVSDMVGKAAKVRSINESTVDHEQLEFITQAITRIIEEEIAEHDREMADRVVERLRSIKMPERRQKIDKSQVEDMAELLRASGEAIMEGVQAAAKPEAESEGAE